VVLRYDAKERRAHELYDEWSWSPTAAEGCDVCDYGLEQVFRRRWLGRSHALVFRDETVSSAGGSHCEAHCSVVCDGGDAPCLKECQQTAEKAAAKLDASCKMQRALRRWELVERGEGRDARIALWPRQRRRR
jgi:hypothetical protein